MFDVKFGSEKLIFLYRKNNKNNYKIFNDGEIDAENYQKIFNFLD